MGAPSGHKYRHEFNCYQRASAHLIESTPTLLGTFVLATTLYPALSLVFFLFFLASRVFFSSGTSRATSLQRTWGRLVTLSASSHSLVWLILPSFLPSSTAKTGNPM